uniref:Cytochrome P450 n=1 Tax=Rhabditophanes sp. KR3021 TaxID=114890 RepID=A0AC35U106_9BILA
MVDAINSPFVFSESFSYLLLILLLFCTFYMISAFLTQSYPPGPIKLPIIGNLLQINFEAPYDYVNKCKQKFGKVFTIWMPYPVIVICDPVLIRECLIKYKDIFSARPNSFVYGIFTGHKKHGDGIILADGEKWHAQRSFAIKTFKEFGVGSKKLESKILFHTHRLTAQIYKKMGEDCQVELDLHHLLSWCIGNIIHDLVMGKYYDFMDPDFIHFKELIDSVLRDFASPKMMLIDRYPWIRHVMPFYTNYKKNGMRLQKFFLDEIERHESKIGITIEDFKPSNFIDAYLQEMNQSHDEELSKLTLALNAGDLWAGGMESTVTVLRWAVMYMVQYPHIQTRCHNEIVLVVGEDEELRSEHRKCLPYTRAALDEILRVVNVLPWGIPHRAIEEVEIGGHFIPKDAIVFPQIGAVHFNPDFFMDPKKFNPERFLDQNESYKFDKNFEPFGAGPRRCLGKLFNNSSINIFLGEPLARMELFLIFATLMRSFQFSRGSNGPPNFTKNVGMTATPKDYVPLIRRRNAKKENNNTDYGADNQMLFYKEMLIANRYRDQCHDESYAF